jgi:hypothetical protein
MPKDKMCSGTIQNKPRTEFTLRQETTTERAAIQKKPGMRLPMANHMAPHPRNTI